MLPKRSLRSVWSSKRINPWHCYTWGGHFTTEGRSGYAWLCTHYLFVCSGSHMLQGCVMVCWLAAAYSIKNKGQTDYIYQMDNSYSNPRLDLNRIICDNETQNPHLDCYNGTQP